MVVLKMRKKKGFALVITIVITFVMSLTAVTMLTLVYRYTNTIKERKETLQETVNPSNVNKNSYENYYWYI